MNTWTVTFTPDSGCTTRQAEIVGKDYTDAYLNFTYKHPVNCIILDIKQKTE